MQLGFSHIFIFFCPPSRHVKHSVSRNFACFLTASCPCVLWNRPCLGVRSAQQDPPRDPGDLSRLPTGLLFLIGHFHHCLMQEEKTRLLKERLDQIYSVNERHCFRAPIYGADLLGVCSLACREQVLGLRALGSRPGKVAGPVSGCMSPSESQKDLIVTLTQRQESLQDVIDRCASVLAYSSPLPDPGSPCSSALPTGLPFLECVMHMSSSHIWDNSSFSGVSRQILCLCLWLVSSFPWQHT